MPRSAADPIAQMIAIQRENREQRAEQYKEATTERGYGLDVAKFQHQTAHDAATLALDRQRTSTEQVAKYMSMAKEMYELNQATRKAADVGHFYNMLTKVNPDDPDAANKIGALKAAFPQAMQDEGVRATLSNDWSQVLSQRGLSRSDREAADKRAFLMNYAAAAAKDDEYGKNNPELKAIHDMYAKDLVGYEAKKRLASGEEAPAAPAPVTVDTFFSKPAGAQQPAAQAQAPAPAAPTAPAQAPTVAPAGEPAPTAPPTVPLPTLGASVPAASTPKEQQTSEWASANVADSRSEINDMLNQSPETQFLGNPTPTPTPPPPQPKKAEEAAV